MNRGPVRVVILVLCAACSSEPATPAGPAIQGVAYAKAPKLDTASRLNLVWADQVLVDGTLQSAGIRGDGRLSDGAPATGPMSNEYQGDYCGVGAVIEYGVDLNADPDGSYASAMQTSCGAARYYNVYLALPATTATPVSPHHRAAGLAQGLVIGQSRSVPGGFGVQLVDCSPLMFDDQYPPAQSQRQTRLPDVSVGGRTVRQWRVESQGSHRAMCMKLSKGKSVPTGVSYHLPFAVTVTEVPYPSPIFP